MVSSVSNFDAGAYLNQLKGISPSPAPTPVATAPAPTPAPTTAATGSNVLGLSPEILSLLQGVSSQSGGNGLISSLLGDNSSSSSSSSSLVSSLLGNGSSTTDGLSGVYSSLLAQEGSTLPVAQAVASAPKPTSNPVNNLISSYNKTLNAGNSSLLKDAQAVLAANSKPITS